MLSACSYVCANKFTACVQNARFSNARRFWVAHATGQWCVDDVLFNATPNVQQTLVVRQHYLVDALLHCCPVFVVHRVKIWTVRWPLFRWNKVRRVSRRRSSIVSRARCAGALSCWNTNSFPNIECMGVWKKSRFSTNMSLYLGMDGR